MNNVLVTFEGIEGSGKSTQASLFRGWLAGRGVDCILTREPGGTSLGEQIRKVLLRPTSTDIDPLAELLLYLASRAQIVGEVITPALAAGKVVLVDRFYDSTLAYQGWGRGLDRQMILDMNRFTTPGVVPDITFVFDLEPEIGLSRVTSRSSNGLPDRIEAERISFHRRVRKGFLQIASEEERCRLLDGTLPADIIQDELRKMFSDHLESRGASR